MKLSNVDGPLVIKPNAKADKPSSVTRAIEILTGKQSPKNDIPVANANQITPEDLGAVLPSQTAEITQENTESKGQIDNSESISSTSSESAASSENKEAEGKKEESISSQFAVLARKEKALRAKAQAQDLALKTREAEFKAREDAIKAKESEYQSDFISKSKLLEDPLTVLLEQGISYEQLANMALNQSSQDPATKVALQQIREELRLSREETDRLKRASEDSAKGQYEAAINEIRREANHLVNSDESFELIKATGSAEDVVELIKSTYESEGFIMSVEEAAKEIEDYLVEEAEKIARSKKIQSRLNPTVKKEEVKTQAVTKSAETKATSPTLTNSMSTSRQLTAKERAILAFQGKLNK